MKIYRKSMFIQVEIVYFPVKAYFCDYVCTLHSFTLKDTNRITCWLCWSWHFNLVLVLNWSNSAQKDSSFVPKNDCNAIDCILYIIVYCDIWKRILQNHNIYSLNRTVHTAWLLRWTADLILWNQRKMY